jgi:ATP-binding cassette subfamily B protein
MKFIRYIPTPWNAWAIPQPNYHSEANRTMSAKKSILSSSLSDYTRALRLIFSISPTNTLLQFLLQVCIAFLPVGILYATKILFDQILATERDFENVIFWLFIVGACQLLLNLIHQWLIYLGQLQQQKITDHTVGMIMEKSICIPYSYFEDDRYHDNLHLAQKQSLYRLPQLLQHFQQLMTNFLGLGFLMVYFFTLITTYAWIILMVVLPLAMVKWYSGYALHRLEKRLIPMERQAGYFHQVLSSASHAKEIRTLGFGPSFLVRFNALRKNIFGKKQALQKRLLRYSLVAEALETIALFAILFGVVQQAFLETIAIGLLVVYIQGLQRIQSNLKNFLQALVNLFHQRIFLRDLFKFFELAERNSTASKEFFPSGNFGITLENINFSYSNEMPMVLQNITMKIPHGSMIGLVGANGSGKSTLVKLLAGLYRPDSGSIHIGKTALENLDENSFQENTTFLFQDFEKYFLTIKEIITMGMEGMNDTGESKIQKAIQQAGAESLITGLEKGLDTKMGRIFKEGQELSGGEWQKLAIARAFYRDAPIVVMDEPTSALDAVSENHIFQELRKNAADKIIVLVTHRLYNLKDTDYIYVLEDGKIVQEGKFIQLANTAGIFRQLYEQQKF